MSIIKDKHPGQEEISLVYLLENNQVVILAGEGESDRATRIPQVLLKSSSSNKTICITEPKRAAAIQLAQNVASDLNYRLGTVIGYSVKYKDFSQSGDTLLKFTTHHVLIREIAKDPLLLQYSVIVVDECHDTSLDKDILLGLLRCILLKRNDLKILMCCANLQLDKLRKFFTIQCQEPAILMVERKAHAITIYHSEKPVADYRAATIDTVISLHESIRLASGKFLIFLAGREDVDYVCDKLKMYAETTASRLDLRKLKVLPFYASLSPQEVARVFDEDDSHARSCRMCIVSTNLAVESAISIRDVGFVVDSGFTKVKQFDHRTGLETLVVIPISKSLAQQRARLSGSSREGRVYRLYPQFEYELLDSISLPDIQRSSLVEPLMLLMSLGVANPLLFPLMSRMPKKNLVASFEELSALQAIDSSGKITPSGQMMAQFELDPKLSRSLVCSLDAKGSIPFDLIKIIAMTQVKDIFVKNTHHNGQSLWSNASLASICALEGDLLSYLNIFNGFNSNDRSPKWCQKRNLNHQSLLNACDVAKRLEQQVTEVVGARPNANHQDRNPNQHLRIINKCIASGLFANAAYMNSDGNYKTVRGDQTVHVHPSSVYASDLSVERPKYLLCVEILHTTKSYMRHLMSVDQSLLLEAAPHFYNYTCSVSLD